MGKPILKNPFLCYSLFTSQIYIAHIELKKDSNPKLAHGLSKQLPTYMSSEDVRLGFFIIFDFGDKNILKLKEKLEKQRVELEKDQNLKLRIIYIDVKPKTLPHMYKSTNFFT